MIKCGVDFGYSALMPVVSYDTTVGDSVLENQRIAAHPRAGTQNGCIGKKGATYAAFFRGFTNVWGVSRSWASADRGVAVVLTGSKPGV